MKKIFVSLILLMVTTLLISCIKQEGVDTQTSDNNDLTTAIIPTDFNWKMTQNITTNFTSVAHKTMVFVSLPDANAPFSSFLVGAGIPPMTLDIPTNYSKLKVQYQKEDGLSTPVELQVMANAVSYAVPADSKEVIEFPQAVAYSKANDTGKPVSTIIPATGWGTLMFEDLYPAIGDYDFNDLVINYKIELLPFGMNNVGALTATFRVAAVGGSLPFEFYMQLDNVLGSNVGYEINGINGGNFNVSGIKNSPDPKAIKIEKFAINKNDDPVAFSIKGIKANKKYPNAAGTLNVTKGKELLSDELVEFKVKIVFENFVALEEFTKGQINFFIAQNNPFPNSGNVPSGFGAKLYEIHCNGYRPTYQGEVLYDYLKKNSNITNACKQSYTSNSNLVWAINIPDNILHTYECQTFVTNANGKKVKEYNFTNAYPNFKAWAESGGASNKDWYKDGSRNMKYLVPAT
ncbi:MAG: LruC domain-containing protein [Odoribacter sp.]